VARLGLKGDSNELPEYLVKADENDGVLALSGLNFSRVGAGEKAYIMSIDERTRY
jgi:hypothetical protein